jgi:hypothetical protein
MEERPGAQRLNRKLMVFPDRCREQVYHHLSHFEIGGDKRIYQHLSNLLPEGGKAVGALSHYPHATT